MSDMPNASTPADLMVAIHDDLSRWAAAQRGTIHLARDLDDAVTMLSNTPQGWLGVLHWQGETPAGTGTRRSPVVEHDLRIFLRANLGPTAKPNIALVRATAASPTPFLDVVSQVRYRMLSYTFKGVNPPGDRLTYKGCQDTIPVGGYMLAAFSLLFGVYGVIDMPGQDELVPVG
jgi:hypothetical protein